MADTPEGNLQSSPLTKDEVNTVIVSLRPAVAQARVHIIHQHARHVKNLKSKKCSSDKQKEQNDRKIKRYVQEIELLKKSSRDSISRYVLITKKSFSDVVKKESKTQKYNMKVRSYVRVSEHAAVAKIVKALRLVKANVSTLINELYFLFSREKHRDWELVLPRIVQKLGKKKKKQTQEENAEETNSLKQEIVRNNVEESDEEIEEGSDSEEELNPKTEVESVRGGEREEGRQSDSVQELEQDSGSDKSNVESDEEGDDGSDEDENEDDSNDEERHSDSVQKLEQDSGSEKSKVESDEEYDDGSDEDEKDDDSSDEELNSDENSFVSSLKEALGKTEKQSSIVKVSKTRKIQEVDGESVVKMLDLKSRNAKKELMQTQEKTDNSHNKAGAQKRSSFFLGGESDDEEDFEQSDVESDEDGHGEGTHQRNGGVENKNFRPKFDKRIDKRGSDSHSQKRDPNFGGKRKQFQKVTSVKKPKFNKGPDRPYSAPAEDRNRNKNVVKKDIKVKPTDNNKIVDVHPSWEAKQKQKPSIQTFQGKKTVFE